MACYHWTNVDQDICNHIGSRCQNAFIPRCLLVCLCSWWMNFGKLCCLKFEYLKKLITWLNFCRVIQCNMSSNSPKVKNLFPDSYRLFHDPWRKVTCSVEHAIVIIYTYICIYIYEIDVFLFIQLTYEIYAQATEFIFNWRMDAYGNVSVRRPCCDINGPSPKLRWSTPRNLSAFSFKLKINCGIVSVVSIMYLFNFCDISAWTSTRVD